MSSREPQLGDWVTLERGFLDRLGHRCARVVGTGHPSGTGAVLVAHCEGWALKDLYVKPVHCVAVPHQLVVWLDSRRIRLATPAEIRQAQLDQLQAGGL